jgi:ribonuclease HI
MTLPKIEIYSDWGARPNPGPGWYWVVMKYKNLKKEFSGFVDNTTNNRMELTWAIIWLEKLKTRSDVTLYTDSQYTINGIEKWWAKKWKLNNWMRTKSEKAINYDLWERLLNIVEKHKVKFKWVKWHNGHIENERCDELATEQILKNTSVSVQLDNQKTKDNLIKKILNTNIDKNIKITREWQECRKCWTKVIKKVPKKINTKNKSFYYRYYLNCPWCSTNYFVDDAKVML